MNYSQEIFGKTPPYSFTKTIYYKPDGVNAKDYPEKIFYKKISRKNIRTITQAKQLFAEAEIKAKMAIEQKIAAYDVERKIVEDDNLTLRKAHLHTMDGLKQTTAKKYENILKNYVEPFLDIDEDVKTALTASKLTDWLNKIQTIFEEKNVSEKTIYNVKRRIKAMIDYAVQREKINKQILPEIRLTKPKFNQVDNRHLWTIEERDLFVDYLKNTTEVFYIFYAILTRGLRFNEVRALKVNDIFTRHADQSQVYMVNIDKQTVNGSASKTTKPKTQQSYRQIYITENVYDAVIEYAKKQNLNGDDFLFKSSSTQNIIESKALRKVFNDYKKQYTPGKLKMTPHKFRHIFAIHALKKGKNVVEIAKHLGNTPGVVFKDYVLQSAMNETLLDI